MSKAFAQLQRNWKKCLDASNVHGFCEVYDLLNTCSGESCWAFAAFTVLLAAN